MTEPDFLSEPDARVPLWRRPQLIAMFVLGGGFVVIALLVGMSILAPRPGDERPITGGVFAVLLFGSVGSGVAWVAVRVVRDLKREERAQERWPGQPWRWQDDWAKGEIVHSAWAKPAGLAIFAVLWNSVSWFAMYLFAVAQEPRDGPGAVMVLSVFCLIGIGLALWVASTVCEARRWGSSTFVLKSRPAAVGQRLIGFINTSRCIAPESEILMFLTCRESRVHRAKLGKLEVGKGERYEYLHWQASRVVRTRLKTADDKSTRIPVAFDIPSDAKSASHPISWILEVSASGGWPSYNAEFEVPVFRIRGEKRQPLLDDDALEQWLAEEDFESMLQRSGGHVIRDDPQSLEMSFVVGKRWVVLASQVLFLAVWAIASLGLYLGSGMPAFVLIGFPLFGVAIAGAIVAETCRTLFISVTPEGIRYRREWFGFSWTRQIDHSKIERIEALQERHGMVTQMDECVRLRTTDGKSHLLAYGLPQRVVSNAIAKKVEAVSRARCNS